MCTLTWHRTASRGYEVFFNRDEKKTRTRAEPPTRREAGGVRFLAPRDPDGGGTWMLANERGMVICLLNRWHEEAGPPARTMESRGQLVWELASLENLPAVEEHLRAVDLSRYRPWTLVAFDEVGEGGWEWNGHSLRETALEMPLCSSSFRFEEVRTARQVRFSDLRASPPESEGLLESFHAGSGEVPSAWTVRMCRSDAQTMSRSHVVVQEGKVTWKYWAEGPELVDEPVLTEMELGLRTLTNGG